jgi:hypothetical protein
VGAQQKVARRRDDERHSHSLNKPHEWHVPVIPVLLSGIYSKPPAHDRDYCIYPTAPPPPTGMAWPPSPAPLGQDAAERCSSSYRDCLDGPETSLRYHGDYHLQDVQSRAVAQRATRWPIGCGREDGIWIWHAVEGGDGLRLRDIFDGVGRLRYSQCYSAACAAW